MYAIILATVVVAVTGLIIGVLLGVAGEKFKVEVDQVFINSSYEVTLYCGDNEFLLGKKDFYESQISAIPAILKAATENSLSYDMRYYEENDKKITAKPLN